MALRVLDEHGQLGAASRIESTRGSRFRSVYPRLVRPEPVRAVAQMEKVPDERKREESSAPRARNRAMEKEESSHRLQWHFSLQ